MKLQIKKISRENLFKLIDSLCSEFEVIAPVKTGGDIFFNHIKNSSDITLDYINAVESPKRFFFPQIELMFKMDLNELKTLVDKEERKTRKKLIFGIRTCDLKAINGVDRFFSGERTDSYYQKLRQNTVVVNFLCNECAPECFCTAIPGETLYCDGYDLRLSGLEDGYLIEADTEEGKEILKKNRLLFSETEKRDFKLREENVKILEEKIKRNNPFAKTIENLRKGKVSSKAWENIALSCQDCGGCCYVCPVCTCYNTIEDFENELIKRYRYWDSCLFSGFSRMVHAYNPIPTPGERLKYRFMHRLKYFEERYSSAGCTGCGRCDVVCLGDIGTGAVLMKIKNKEPKCSRSL